MEDKKRYVVTHEQLRNLEHFQNMFDRISMEIRELCESEKSDIEYGFELGRIYSNSRSHYLEMMSVVNDIHNNQLMANGK